MIIAEAERIARDEWGAAEMHMTVISVREDLIAWYERRGYRRTGKLTPSRTATSASAFPPRDDLRFELLVKTARLSAARSPRPRDPLRARATR